MIANNFPYSTGISVTNSILAGDTTWFHNNPIKLDFRFSTTISNEVRKYEPEQFYLVLEMLCAHMKEFKGGFPGFLVLLMVYKSTNQHQTNLVIK